MGVEYITIMSLQLLSVLNFAFSLVLLVLVQFSVSSKTSNVGKVEFVDIEKEDKELFESVLAEFDSLSGVNIVVQYKASKTTMQTVPPLLGITSSYSININRSERANISFKDLDSMSKRGIIAHELCHVIDFESNSSFYPVTVGAAYFNKEKWANFERKIDLMTIEHGFGEELYSWNSLALELSKEDEAYHQFKLDNYLRPGEISDYLELRKSEIHE